MVQLTDAQLAPMISQARNVEELDTLVAHRYGPDHVATARLAAVRANGARWVFGYEPTPVSALAKVRTALLRPSNAVLVVGCAVAILAFLCPPYTVTVQEGISLHVGFLSIFRDGAASRFGTVNVPLLALELLATAALTATCFFLAMRVEQDLG